MLPLANSNWFHGWFILLCQHPEIAFAKHVFYFTIFVAISSKIFKQK